MQRNCQTSESQYKIKTNQYTKKIEIKSKSMATDWCQNLERVKEIIITDK